MTKQELQKQEVVKRLVLKFPKRFVDQPVIYHLTKDFDLMFNILKANIESDKEGFLVIELSGKEQNYRRGIEFLKKLGITVQQLDKDIKFDKTKCVSCGVCVPLCPVGAFKVDKETYEIGFDENKCIVCELCIKICPVKAIKVEF